MPGPLIPMIGYWRVSLGREDMISPEIQQERGSTWAALNGRRIVYWIEDPDETGRNFERRVTEAIAGIEAGDAVEIGLVRYDRWGRDTLESLVNLKRVQRVGGDVISWTEPYDAKTAIGKFGRTQAFAIAQLQSDQIGEAWQSAHANRLARQLPATGTRRFGYTRLGRVPDPVRANVWKRDMADPEGERYVPDPETGPVLAELYKRYAAGEGVRSLVRDLNARGFTTTRGAPWSHTTLMQVLASGFGAGLLRVHDPACKCGKTTHQCPRVLYRPGAQKPVIGPEVWEAFLARMAERRKLPPRLHEAVWPLSGLLYCGTCTRRLTVHSSNGIRGFAYRCPRKGEQQDCATGVTVHRSVAEAAVLELLGELAADIEAQAQASRARIRTASRARSQATRDAAEETRIRNALSRLVTQRALDEDMPAEVYDQSRKDLLGQLEAVQARLAEARNAEARNAGTYVPVVVGLVEEWDTLAPARRRELLGALIDRIVVHHTGFRRPARVEIIPVWEV